MVPSPVYADPLAHPGCACYSRRSAIRSAPQPLLTKSEGNVPMKMSSAIRVVLLALTAFAGATLSSASHADSGTVSLTIYKAGWIIGGSGGGGVLNFRGRNYALSTGGLDYGLVFGGSKTVLHGRVRRACGRRRRARDRADQPEGRGAGTVRPAGRADGQCGFERAGDYAEVK